MDFKIVIVIICFIPFIAYYISNKILAWHGRRTIRRDG